MNSEQDLLYPAFLKFYSALSSLERFHKEKSFFENISSLDTFFSEFRNVTFVLQKSLAHTDYKLLYENLRDKYFSGLKWFVDTRNETTKQHPFELIKKIEITAYMPWGSFEILEKQFSVNDDKPLASVIDEAKSGHPGICLGAAPTIYTLFRYHLKFNPEDGNWLNRDRFILSAGHGSALLYSTLFFA